MKTSPSVKISNWTIFPNSAIVKFSILNHCTLSHDLGSVSYPSYIPSAHQHTHILIHLQKRSNSISLFFTPMSRVSIRLLLSCLWYSLIVLCIIHQKATPTTINMSHRFIKTVSSRYSKGLHCIIDRASMSEDFFSFGWVPSCKTLLVWRPVQQVLSSIHNLWKAWWRLMCGILFSVVLSECR